ncbi:hypothetical protein BJ138DRAFT_1159775, partial [Hygrophoropsis aurantiaca]
VEEEENRIEDELIENAKAAAAILLAGNQISQSLHVESRQPHRFYLCRPQLLPNPRVSTPWQVLYETTILLDKQQAMDRVSRFRIAFDYI